MIDGWENSPIWIMKGETMLERNGHRFHHRRNGNGTHDSICCECYLTVASASGELELAEYERAPACDPVQLYQVSQFVYPQPSSSEGKRKKTEREGLAIA